MHRVNSHTLSTILGVRQRWKARLGPLWWYSAILFASSKLSDVVNLYVGVFLIPATILPADLGAIAPLRMLMGVAAVPMGLLSGAGLKFVSAFNTGDEKSLVKAVLKDLAVVAAVLSVGVVFALWLGHDFALARLRVSDPRIVWALAAVIILSYWQAVSSTAVQGLMRFRHLILSGVVGSIAYLLLMVLLLRSFHLLGYVLALAGAGVVGTVYLAWSIREYIRPGIVPASYRAHWPQIKRYVLSTGALSLFMGLAALIEPWTIRNFTSSMDSAGFYMAFMFGQIPLYAAAAFLPFLFSLASERHELGQRTESLLGQSVLAMAAAGIPLIVLLALFGERLLNLRQSWSQYAAYSPLLWKVCVSSTLQGIISAYISHENACHRFFYVKLFVPILAVEIILLYAGMGWGFFRPHLSPALWESVDLLIGPRIEFAVRVMIGFRLLLSLPAFWHLMTAGRRKDAGHVSVRG
jgi:O-antigen/teichoic acid export membrane protein